MAKTTDYYKIVPSYRGGAGRLYQIGNDIKTRNTIDMYSVASSQTQTLRNTVKFTGNRMVRYTLYEQMDRDIDVGRALDTIADEMTPINPDNNLPFDVHYNNDIDDEVDESTVVTLRAALLRWSRIHKLDNRLWAIVRQVLKYGDCFFIKVKVDGELHPKWRFVNIRDVLGIGVNNNTNEIVYYQIKTTSRALTKTQKDEAANSKVVNIKKDDILHFSLFDETKETFPFGESVLANSYRTFKQMELLEDSLIIYRIVRAPERRVFYVDTGKMSPAKSHKYLEKVKNDVRQRRIPVNRNGVKSVDSTYNPESMLEDIFLAQPADGRGSRIETLASGGNLGEMDDIYYFQDKLFRGLKIPVSYMVNTQDNQGAQIADGRVGTAYIQELRFVRFTMRLQELLDGTFDAEFKQFLEEEKINVDFGEFTIKFNEPENFAIYRELELAGDLLNTFQSANDIPFMSKRWALMKYMNWSEEDIQTNEALLKQERGIKGTVKKDVTNPDTGEVTGSEEFDEMRQIYDPSANQE